MRLLLARMPAIVDLWRACAATNKERVAQLLRRMAGARLAEAEAAERWPFSKQVRERLHELLDPHELEELGLSP